MVCARSWLIGAEDAARVPYARAQAEVPAFSATLEVRLALLVEGAHAFAAVLGIDEAVVGFDLVAVAGEQVHLQPVVDGLLRLAHRDRRVRGDLSRGLERFGERCAGLADLVHQAPGRALLCAESTRGEDQLLGAPLANGARKVLRAGPARHDAQAQLGERELRAFR